MSNSNSQNDTMNLQNLIGDIKDKVILLPDFQRRFVWREEERQIKLIASVLAKMPIGSILLLESSPDEYSSKEIGRKKLVDTSKIEAGTVKFLLDGQQRITVLTNVFSNVIHNSSKKVSELASPSLKKRFFLCVPKWKKHDRNDCLYGVSTLDFLYKEPNKKDPSFLSSDIIDFIKCYTFNAGDNSPYNPQTPLSDELDKFCINGDEEGYLIPLFLMSPNSERNETDQALATLRFEKILEQIAYKIASEIENYFTALSSKEEKDKFIDNIFHNSEKKASEIKNSKEPGNTLSKELQAKAEVWRLNLKTYLDSCIQNVLLNEISVSSDKRARAIDIYENLNMGGVCLNIFDLIMAKVGKVSTEPFYDRVVTYIKGAKKYPVTVIPEKIQAYFNIKKDKQKYNSSVNTNCYSESKDEINSQYINAFLNVLSLYTNNKDYDPDNYKLEYTKRNEILKISPDDINENAEKVCLSIDRALFFFQTRCGIRDINEINYSLMIPLVATIFTNEKWFKDKKVHDNLEAWYWTSLFSGNYDRDQGTRFIDDLQSLSRSFLEKKDCSWIANDLDYILDFPNFSDKDLLLMQKVDQDRTPKIILRKFICQYLLSKTYTDMFDANKTISVFSDVSNTLEAHHIIPLGSVKKYGESTKELREDEKNICNSPLNFVYITKDSNDEISATSLEEYVQKITEEARSGLFLSDPIEPSTSDNVENIKKILGNRYSSLKGDIKRRVSSLLGLEN